MTDRIVVSAVVFRDEAGRVLTVRKRGTRLLMFPGGKPEPGETAEQAAVREVREEIGVAIEAGDLQPLGRFDAPAANEPGRTVRAVVFAHPFAEATEPRAEIEQLEWVDPAAADDRIAPLLRDAVFPALLGG